MLSIAYQYSNPNRPRVENEYDKVKAENDWTSAQVAAYPNRLYGFCSVNPLKDYALDEIARCGRDPQLRRGLKMHFGNSDVDLSNREHVTRLQQVFAVANRQRMAIVVHVRASVTMKREYGGEPGAGVHRGGLAGGARRAGAGRTSRWRWRLQRSRRGRSDGRVRRRDSEKGPRMRNVYIDVSDVAGLGDWRPRAELIAIADPRARGRARAVRIGWRRWSDPTPQQAGASFRELPLTDAEFRTIASNVTSYLK